MADIGNQDYPTILGPDATIKGEVSFEKGLRLHGRIEGKVTTQGRLHIAKEAKLMADVNAGSIVIEGEEKGNLTASDRIDLKQSARYEGDLSASRLTVDEGAVFSGHVSVGPDAVKGGRAAGSGGQASGRPAGANVPPAQQSAQPVK